MMPTRDLLACLADSIAVIKAGSKMLTDEQLEILLERVKCEWLKVRPLLLQTLN